MREWPSVRRASTTVMIAAAMTLMTSWASADVGGDCLQIGAPLLDLKQFEQGQYAIDAIKRFSTSAVRAIDTCRKAISLAPDDDESRSVLGLALLASDKRDEGLKELKLAGRRRPEALFFVGVVYESQKDWDQARRYLRLAADKDVVAARVMLGLLMVSGATGTRDIPGAIPLLRKAAEKGSFVAQALLATVLQSGVGIPRAPVEAYKWTLLARVHSASDRVEKLRKRVDLIQIDLEASMSREQLAQGQKLALATFEALHGAWVPKAGSLSTYASIRQKWREAGPPENECDRLTARYEDPDRRSELVTSADFARAIPACAAAVAAHPDVARFRYEHGTALAWAKRNADAYAEYRRAADAGYPAAIFEIGYAYYNDTAFGMDFSKARTWLRRATELGVPDAFVTLGEMYFSGNGVKQNAYESSRLKYTGALFDNFSGEFGLGDAYQQGYGVPISFVRAWAWLDLAASHPAAVMLRMSETYAHDRDGMTKNMTEAQVAEAQRLAAEWKRILRPARAPESGRR